MRLVAVAVAVAGITLVLGFSHGQAAPNRAAGVRPSAAAAATTDIPAAKRQKKHGRKQPRANREDDAFLAIRSQTHQAERAQVACPRSGCQAVPRGCLREPERSFSGEPTGFDRIVCPMR
jgi:hypothetical protein